MPRLSEGADPSVTVLNPFRTVQHDIMADADLAGPLVFCFFFGIFLLLVRRPLRTCCCCLAPVA